MQLRNFVRAFIALATAVCLAQGACGVEPGPEAKAKPASKKQAAPAAPVADLAAPIDEGEYEIVIRSLTDLHSKAPEKIKELSAAFRKEYKLPGDAALSKQIKTQAHVQFINAFLAS